MSSKGTYEERILQEIRNGLEAKELINHGGWKLVIEALEEEAIEANIQLIDVDCTNSAKIFALQSVVLRYKDLLCKVHELINIGSQAQSQLN